MKLTWRQFETYLDAFSWLLNEESEKGQKDNQLYDLQAMTREPRLVERKKRLVEETKAKLREFEERQKKV